MEKFLKKVGIEPKDKKNFELAFVHRSFLNENKSFKKDNERLEFLGDAVLELVTTDYLFKKYKTESEGFLTNLRSTLVKKETLSKVSKDIGIGEHIKLSKGEESSGGRENDYILANCFEAVIGAIYIDLGIEEAKKFIEKFLLASLNDFIEKDYHIDSKSKIQAFIQGKTKITPEYLVLREEGPDHLKNFTVGIYCLNILVGIGSGTSKQNAQREAAKNACVKFEIK